MKYIRASFSCGYNEPACSACCKRENNTGFSAGCLCQINADTGRISGRRLAIRRHPAGFGLFCQSRAGRHIRLTSKLRQSRTSLIVFKLVIEDSREAKTI